MPSGETVSHKDLQDGRPQREHTSVHMIGLARSALNR